ncbi:flagellar hook-length control protein FliK [Enterobacter ludwigii]
MTQPTPVQPQGGLPPLLKGKPASSGNFNASTQHFSDFLLLQEDITSHGSTTPLVKKVEQLLKMPGIGPDWPDRLNNLLVQLNTHEQGDKETANTLLETVSQLWQRQPDDAAITAQMQDIISALQNKFAIQPNGESVIARLRGMQEIRNPSEWPGANLTIGNLLNESPYHINKVANGAPLAPLQVQAFLTQQQPDQRLLALLGASTALNNEQAGQLPPQIQTSVTAGPQNRNQTGAGGHEFSPLNLGKQSSLWAEQMLSPLAERLRIQNHLGVKQAILRLDPPDLGKLDLQVRTEGDRVFIQISATNPTVRDQLLQMSDRLRHELMLGQSYSQLDVEIGQHSEQSEGQHNSNDDSHVIEANDRSEDQEQHAHTTVSRYSLDTYI